MARNSYIVDVTVPVLTQVQLLPSRQGRVRVQLSAPVGSTIWIGFDRNVVAIGSGFPVIRGIYPPAFTREDLGDKIDGSWFAISDTVSEIIGVIDTGL